MDHKKEKYGRIDGDKLDNWITDARVGEGYRPDTAVHIAPEGTSAEFSAEEIITTAAKGYLHLRCEGDAGSATGLPTVHAAGTKEMTVYTVFRHAVE